jgi:aspartyl-tRNA(Asn)/glutamyl-tRNA(Gln) amidotransferase subunit A
MSTKQTELHYLSIRAASDLIRRRELSPVELTQAHLKRIEELDGQLRAYRAVMSETALAEAQTAEADIRRGDYKGPLHGIPVAHKEQHDVKGIPSWPRSTGSTPPVPAEDATPVRKLREAGSVLLGTLVMPGALRGRRGAPPPGPPRNPWDLAHITGGSSSGSGAALAAGLCMGSLGEDSAGSIRKPASLCGVVGLKATYGVVSRRGLAPLSWSVDHSGPMARTVEDTSLMLQAIAGYDPKDPTSIRAPTANYSASLADGVRGLVVGVPRHFIQEPDLGVEPETLAAFDKALAELESLGARVEEVKIPSLAYATIANTVIFYSESFASRRSELLAHPQRYELSRRAAFYLGGITTSTDYVQAQRARSRIQRELAQTFRSVDVLALPGQPKPAAAFDEHDPMSTVYIQILHNLLTPFNLSGGPALSVPCGFSRAGLPLGLQLAGKPFDEATVLRVGYSYQQHTNWREKRPPI